MSYALEHENESSRLEQQALISAYDLTEELSQINLNDHSKVLDAGCGGGMVSRYMADINPKLSIDAFDGSEIRVAQARSASISYSQIDYNVSDLSNINKSNETYDLIICRYVYEYLKNPQEVTNEFSRLLKKGGKLVIIDFDGILFNFYTSNQKFNNYLTKIKRSFQIDLFVGRKIQHYLYQSGIKNINYNLSVHRFSDIDLEREIENNTMRFNVLGDDIERILGSREETDYFKKNYLKEMTSLESVLFANKFVYIGSK